MERQAYSPKRELGWLLSIGVATALVTAPLPAYAADMQGKVAEPTPLAVSQTNELGGTPSDSLSDTTTDTGTPLATTADTGTPVDTTTDTGTPLATTADTGTPVDTTADPSSDAETGVKVPEPDTEPDRGEPAEKKQELDETAGEPKGELVESKESMLKEEAHVEPATDGAEQAEGGSEREVSKGGSGQETDQHTQDIENGQAVADGTYVFESALSDAYVVDVRGNGSSDGTNVQLYESNGSAAQQWDVVYDTQTKRYAIRKKGTKLALGTAGNAQENGTSVAVYYGDDRTQYIWDIVRSGAGWKLLYSPVASSKKYEEIELEESTAPEETELEESVASKGSESKESEPKESLALDVKWGEAKNATDVRLYTQNGTKAQLFYLLRAEGLVTPSDALKTATGQKITGASLAAMSEGAYVATSQANGVFSLDVRNASTSSGANVQLFRSNGTGAQRLWLHEESTGFYTIGVVGTGRVLSATTSGRVVGINVEQSARSSNRSQWAIRKNADASFSFVNRATGLTLEVHGGEMRNGANIQLYRDNGTAAQKFSLKPVEVYAAATSLSDYRGLYKIQSVVAPNMVFDVVGEVGAAAAKSGAYIQLYKDTGSLDKKFQLVKAGKNGSTQLYYIRCASSGGWLTGSKTAGTQASQQGSSSTQSSAQKWYFAWDGHALVLMNASTGKVLDLAGGATKNNTHVQSYTSNGTDAQHFVLTPTELPSCAGGYFTISSALSPTLRLSAQKTNVQVSSGSIQPRDVWTIARSGSGYVIKHYMSGKVLDVAAGSTKNGANVQLYAANGTKAQLWYPCIEDGGRIGFVNAGSGKALDIANGSTKAGANVQQYAGNGTKAQAWDIRRAVIGKIGYQNPAGYYQVSSFNVKTPAAQWPFNYVSSSRIAVDATRSECVEAFVKRAAEYLGTPYKWDYACAPGVGVDCVGLVMQCCYAVGMDLGEFNPYNHYYTGPNGWHSHDANNLWNYGKVKRVSLKDRKRGDLISWKGHVAIYLGNNKMIEAYPGKGVVKCSVVKSGVWTHGKPRGVMRLFQ